MLFATFPQFLLVVRAKNVYEIKSEMKISVMFVAVLSRVDTREWMKEKRGISCNEPCLCS